MVTHSQEETPNPTFCLRSKSCELHTEHPNFEDLHLRDKTPKHLVLKANMACIHEKQRARVNAERVLKGLSHSDSPALKPSTEAANRKAPRLSVKEVICL